MTSLLARVLEMLIRVRQFGVTHLQSFPESSRGRELFELVDGFIEAVQTHAATQAQHERAAKEKTAAKKAATAAVRELMTSISRTARGMAQNTPGLESKFQMPRGEGVQELLAAARACLTDAEPLKDEFVRRGLPSTFLENLSGRILVLEQSVNEQAQKSAARVAANVSAADAAQRARKAVRELDIIVRNVFGTNEAVLAEWESASHIERAPRRAEEEEETEESSSKPEPAKV